MSRVPEQTENDERTRGHTLRKVALVLVLLAIGPVFLASAVVTALYRDVADAGVAYQQRTATATAPRTSYSEVSIDTANGDLLSPLANRPARADDRGSYAVATGSTRSGSEAANPVDAYLNLRPNETGIEL